VLAYAFQIYFDFCGYSDMAVGLGRMLGFEFLKNFDAPYRAESVTEFWQRWHVNLAVVMLIGGLWHGAKWNFIVWGAYHGLLLGCERCRGKQSFYHLFPRPLRIGLTFALILLSWVLFRADNLTAGWHYFGAMFGLTPAIDTARLLAAEVYTPYRLLILGVSAFLAFHPLQAHDWALRPIGWPRVALLAPLFIICLMVMFSQAFNPFLYFQF